MVRKLTLLLLLLLFLLPMAALADEQIVDEIGLLSQESISQLSDKIDQVECEYCMDLAVLITNQAPLDLSNDLSIVKEFADSYYDSANIGTRANASGILFLLDMRNRVLYISTGGDMIFYITDEREEELLNAMFVYAASGDYEGTIKCFVSKVNEYLWKGIDPSTFLYSAKIVNNICGGTK